MNDSMFVDMCNNKKVMKLVWVGESNVKAANLLNHNIYLISIFHVQIFGSLCLVKTFTVEEESDVVGVQLS